MTAQQRACLLRDPGDALEVVQWIQAQSHCRFTVKPDGTTTVTGQNRRGHVFTGVGNNVVDASRDAWRRMLRAESPIHGTSPLA